MGVQKNEWIDNMKKIDGEKYSSDTQYCTKSVLGDYQWFYFGKTCVNLQIIGVSYALSIDGN